MKKWPDIIYLQVGGYTPEDLHTGDITWCADKINDDDIAFRRCGTPRPKGRKK